jgi:GH35 family endo-1,4-beta-xylanase
VLRTRRVWFLLMTMLVSPAVGREEPTDAELLAGATARIERHRKGDALVAVVDEQGRPVPGAVVAIEQTRHAFLFGCNIFLWGKAGSPADEQTYRDRFAEVFNFATLPFYWPAYEPRQGEPAHDSRLAVARWCAERGIRAKGHPLAWNYADPRWLPEDPAAALTLQFGRIDDIVPRFRGQIDTWDVVNEPTHYERDEFRKRAPRMTAVLDHAGRVPFVRSCLEHARAGNPDALLLVNDYRTDEPFAALLQELVDGNGGKPPFDAIGLQSHQHGGTWSNRQIWEVCERFARFGLPLHFTETTIVSGKNGWELAADGTPWPSTPEGEAIQADEVERFYTMVFSHPATAALTWWDFSDRNSWMHAPAGFLRADMSPKPAYDRLHQLIKERWWTRD